MSFDKLDNFLIVKIMEFLPLKEKILCKNVCSRWANLYEFCRQNTKFLKLDEKFLIENQLNYGYNRLFGEKMLYKILLLNGKKLEKLIINECDHTVSMNLFSLIGKLCPKLEYLEIKDASNIYFTFINDLKNCYNLNVLIINKVDCFISYNLVPDLVSNLPNIENIHIRKNSYFIEDDFHFCLQRC